MSSIRLFTPGHDSVLDALIMHGIARYLSWCGYEVVDTTTVRRLGFKYVFEVNTNTDINTCGRDMLNELAEILENKASELSISSETRYEFGSSYIVDKISVANNNPGAFDAWLNNLKEALRSINIEDLKDPNHKDQKREGRKSRARSGKYYTVYLPLTPIYGKYHAYDYKITENMQYVIDATCFAFANLGLIYGTFALAEKGPRTVLITAIPVSTIDLASIIIIQRFLEMYRIVNTEMPTLSSLLYALSIGETLAGIEGLQGLVWIVGNEKGRNPYTRGVEVFDLDKLLDFVGQVKYVEPRWPRIVEELIRNEEVSNDLIHILALMAEYVLFSSDRHSMAYLINRELTSIINKLEDENAKRILHNALENIAKLLIDMANKGM